MRYFLGNAIFFAVILFLPDMILLGMIMPFVATFTVVSFIDMAVTKKSLVDTNYFANKIVQYGFIWFVFFGFTVSIYTAYLVATHV